jgi:hypothetical protein
LSSIIAGILLYVFPIMADLRRRGGKVAAKLAFATSGRRRAIVSTKNPDRREISESEG